MTNFLKSAPLIKTWLDKHGVHNYVINEDLTVDVNGGVLLSNQNLSSIPVQFGMVSRWFNISRNKLTSLKGSPKTVGYNFDCSNNQLTSIKYSPNEVKGSFSCVNNLITSLEGCPDIIEEDFNISNNMLLNIEFWPTVVKRRVVLGLNGPLLHSYEYLAYENYSHFKKAITPLLDKIKLEQSIEHKDYSINVIKI